MIHKPLFALWGGYNADDFRKMAQDLDVIQECIMQVYTDNLRPGVNPEEVEQMVNDETFMSSEKASKYFNIEVERGHQAVACSSEFLEKFAKNQQMIPISKMNDESEKIQAKLKLLKLKGGNIHE